MLSLAPRALLIVHHRLCSFSSTAAINRCGRGGDVPRPRPYAAVCVVPWFGSCLGKCAASATVLMRAARFGWRIVLRCVVGTVEVSSCMCLVNSPISARVAPVPPFRPAGRGGEGPCELDDSDNRVGATERPSPKMYTTPRNAPRCEIDRRRAEDGYGVRVSSVQHCGSSVGATSGVLTRVSRQ